MFGLGVYFASNSTKSAQPQYAKQGRDGYQTLLVCDLVLGALRNVAKGDSQLGTEEHRRVGKYDSVYSRPDSAATGGTLNDEFVVYDPRLALPVYVVTFRTVPSGSSSASSMPTALWQRGSGPHQVEIGRDEFALDSDEDKVFRLCESQYLRFMSRAATPTPRRVEKVWCCLYCARS
jgi:hypothetical protein